MSRSVFVLSVTYLALGCLLLAGCALNVPRTIQITGRVLGESITSETAGGAPTAAAPVRATVTCNGLSGTAHADGAYAVAVPVTPRYACTASSPPAYASQAVSIAGARSSTISLDFGAAATPACQFSAVSFHIECPSLHFAPGGVHGSVTFQHTGAPAAGVTVQCPDLPRSAAAGDANPIWISTQTDQTGAFTLHGIPVGTMACLARTAHGDAVPQFVTLAPGRMLDTTFTICASDCPSQQYHFGRVIHADHVYLIFWLPKGYVFEPQGDDARYKSLIAQYVRDVGGTPFYHILSQYWDYLGAIQNSVTLAGTYVDSRPYTHCAQDASRCSPVAATRADPLYDDDLHAEIVRAMSANPSWRTDPEAEFFVFTGYGAEECFTRDPSSACTWKTDNGFCGYHSAFQSTNAGITSEQAASYPYVTYAYIPDHANDGALCVFGGERGIPSPNADLQADATINTVSHEQFESVTNPLPDDAPGWWDDAREHSREGGEVADVCERYFGSIAADGANVTLGNGHRYILQAEWSNLARGCVLH